MSKEPKKYRRLEAGPVIITEPEDAPKRDYRVILETPEASDRRAILWTAAILLSALGLAAWALYVDPDEGYNRFERYGWASWHVWQPLVVTFAITAALLIVLWLCLRPWARAGPDRRDR
jgi:hypothetical protein